MNCVKYFVCALTSNVKLGGGVRSGLMIALVGKVFSITSLAGRGWRGERLRPGIGAWNRLRWRWCRAVALLAISLPTSLAIGQISENAAGPSPRELARLVPDRPDVRDRLITDVAMVGNTAVLGAANARIVDHHMGAVYVFQRRAGEWIFESTLVADAPDSASRFGNSVAIDGNTLVVGAQNSNAAFAFRRRGGRWIQQARLSPPTPPFFSTFGWSVDLEGDTWIVGAPGYGITWGSVYVYRRIGQDWIEEARLMSERVGPMDNFGESVVIEGDIALVGAAQRAVNVGSLGPGYVIVFERTKAGWEEGMMLTAPEGRSSDEFGASVDLEGDRAVIGAPRRQGSSPNLGAVYVFRRDGGDWTLHETLSPPAGQDGSAFGATVAIEGDVIAVGAEHWDEGDENTGAVFLFRRHDERWVLQETVLPRESRAEDHFGVAIDLRGGRLIAGAQGNFHSDPPVRGYGSIFGGLRGPVADLSGDGRIDVRDLLKLLSAWGMCGECSEDLDGDGAVAVQDLLQLLQRMGNAS